MKYLIYGLILTGLLSLNLYGETSGHKMKGKGSGPGWEEKHHNRLDKLAKKLNLDKAQKEKIAAILKEGDERVRAEMDKVRDSARVIREETDRKINDVLTAGQRKKFAEIKKRFQDKREKKEGKHKGEKHGEKDDDD